MADETKSTEKKRGPGKRLTMAAKSGIKNADAGTSNSDLAKRYNTSLQTVVRYRAAKKAPALKAAAEKVKVVRASDEDMIKSIREVLGLSVSASIRLDVISALASRR